jgi:hypothetical protein
MGVAFDLIETAQDVGSCKPTPRNFDRLDPPPRRQARLRRHARPTSP